MYEGNQPNKARVKHFVIQNHYVPNHNFQYEDWEITAVGSGILHTNRLIQMVRHVRLEKVPGEK